MLVLKPLFTYVNGGQNLNYNFKDDHLEQLLAAIANLREAVVSWSSVSMLPLLEQAGRCPSSVLMPPMLPPQLPLEAGNCHPSAGLME